MSLYNNLNVNKNRPTLLICIISLIITLVNVNAIQDSPWSVIAVVTVAVIVYIMLATMILYILYTVWTKPI
jgi:hypothetical protein